MRPCGAERRSNRESCSRSQKGLANLDSIPRDRLPHARLAPLNFHLFALKQALALFDFYGTQLTECDREIEQQLQRLHVPTAESLATSLLG